ncbi:MAG: ferrochelatase [Polyangiaceae bacterium]|nr:ferrochelatase [Polyangiaceae bacterium]
MKRALLLVNMGGPATTRDVEPFLHAIFLDPAILPLPSLARPSAARWLARWRAPHVAKRYEQVGGGSPLGRYTAELARGVREALPAGAGLRVETAFRYCSPHIEEALCSLDTYGVQRVRVLPLFPHHTTAMTGSVLLEARRVATRLGLSLESVPAFGARADIVGLWASMARAGLAEAGPEARVLFTAHGIPMRDVKRGDDYPERVSDSARAVAALLPRGTAWSLAYQSKLGPLPWTRPYLDEEVPRLARQSRAPLVIVPLSFVADCLETLYDLDIVARELARTGGIEKVVRVSSFNADPAFARIVAAMALQQKAEAA